MKPSSFLAALSFTAILGFSAQAVAEESPLTVPGATTVDAVEAKALFDQGTVFVDVRSDKDWSAGRIPDAVHLELKKVYSEESLGAVVTKADPVVLYCNGPSCLRSSEASAKAAEWGFGKIYYFRDGYPAWKSTGYPAE